MKLVNTPTMYSWISRSMLASNPMINAAGRRPATHRVAKNNRDGVAAVFGSAEDMRFLESLPLSHARCVISTISLLDTNRALLHGLRHHNYQGRIALTAHTVYDHPEQLRAAGADLVLEPFALAATAMTDELRDLIGTGSDEDEPGQEPD